ncbi:hypothetical protein HDU93_003859, partial [Gonapodya sp. JEL0774]
MADESEDMVEWCLLLRYFWPRSKARLLHAMFYFIHVKNSKGVGCLLKGRMFGDSISGGNTMGRMPRKLGVGEAVESGAAELVCAIGDMHILSMFLDRTKSFHGRKLFPRTKLEQCFLIAIQFGHAALIKPLLSRIGKDKVMEPVVGSYRGGIKWLLRKTRQGDLRWTGNFGLLFATPFEDQWSVKLGSRSYWPLAASERQICFTQQVPTGTSVSLAAYAMCLAITRSQTGCVSALVDQLPKSVFTGSNLHEDYIGVLVTSLEPPPRGSVGLEPTLPVLGLHSNLILAALIGKGCNVEWRHVEGAVENVAGFLFEHLPKQMFAPLSLRNFHLLRKAAKKCDPRTLRQLLYSLPLIRSIVERDISPLYVAATIRRNCFNWRGDVAVALLEYDIVEICHVLSDLLAENVPRGCDANVGPEACLAIELLKR